MLPCFNRFQHHGSIFLGHPVSINLKIILALTLIFCRADPWQHWCLSYDIWWCLIVWDPDHWPLCSQSSSSSRKCHSSWWERSPAPCSPGWQCPADRNLAWCSCQPAVCGTRSSCQIWYRHPSTGDCTRSNSASLSRKSHQRLFVCWTEGVHRQTSGRRRRCRQSFPWCSWTWHQGTIFLQYGLATNIESLQKLSNLLLYLRVSFRPSFLASPVSPNKVSPIQVKQVPSSYTG